MFPFNCQHENNNLIIFSAEKIKKQAIMMNKGKIIPLITVQIKQGK